MLSRSSARSRPATGVQRTKRDALVLVITAQLVEGAMDENRFVIAGGAQQ